MGKGGFQYIRDYYGVPAKRGARVRTTTGVVMGTITSTQGPYVMVRFDNERHAFPYHPTDLVYL